jgi:hypothetical protein
MVEIGKLVLSHEDSQGDPSMSLEVLLQKLIAIERAVGVAHNNTVRGLVYDAESYLLDMQCQALATTAQQDSEASRRAPYVSEMA